jgi:DNA repair exonuclease SbcCD ATPase subunit
MLTLDCSETTSALDYNILNTSIQDTFAAIDRFEWQAIEELRVMRNNGYYSDAGYASFEDYCEKELTKHGGYRRVRDLLSAKKVVDTLPEELKDKITKPSQTRSLLRLVKTPDKLEQAVAIAAALKEQHEQEIERLQQELRIGLQSEATARAEEQVQEQIQSLQNLYKQQKEQNIQLQQRLDEMESLRQLETENQQLKQRIQDLENAVEQRPSQQWGNTMTQQATKALNKQVKQALEKTIDLRSLAQEPPKENAQECLRLMGIALKNLARAMNNTQALEAAAIILGSEPTPSAIAYRAEQLEMLPQAVSDIRSVLAKPGCTWQEFLNVAQEYEVIKQDYWAELTSEETNLITALQKASSQPDTIGLGSIVAHADPYRTLYVERGEVMQDLGEELVVAWDSWKEQSKKTDRYFRDELRFWKGENQ